MKNTIIILMSLFITSSCQKNSIEYNELNDIIDKYTNDRRSYLDAEVESHGNLQSSIQTRQEYINLEKRFDEIERFLLKGDENYNSKLDELKNELGNKMLLYFSNDNLYKKRIIEIKETENKNLANIKLKFLKNFVLEYYIKHSSDIFTEFDTLKAIVVGEKKVKKGTRFEANVFVSGMHSIIVPNFYVDETEGQRFSEGINGMKKHKFDMSEDYFSTKYSKEVMKIGKHKFCGFIEIPTKKGEKTLPFEYEYEVVK